MATNHVLRKPHSAASAHEPSIGTSVSEPAPSSASLLNVLDQVTQRFTPVWPLRNYVAVNPYLGLADLDWMAAAKFLASFRSSDLYLPLAHFASEWRAGRISSSAVEAAIDEMMRDGIRGAEQLSLIDLPEFFANHLPATPASASEHLPAPLFSTMAEITDRQLETRWTGIILEDIGRYCAAHYDEGQSVWRSPYQDLSLYQAWRMGLRSDRRVEWEGLSGFRAFVARLPHLPSAAIAVLLDQLQVPPALWEPVLLSQAFSVSGWASWTKYKMLEAERQGNSSDDFLGLVALRLAYDTHLSHTLGITQDWTTLIQPWQDCQHPSSPADSVSLWRHCLQRAAEITFRQHVLRQLTPSASHASSGRPTPSAQTPLAQWVFCIDVRSERMRRALEGASTRMETCGYAGFFGIPMELVPWGEQHPIPLAPAPIQPQLHVLEGLTHSTSQGQEKQLQHRSSIRSQRRIWKSFQNGLSSGLSHIETSGFWYGWKMLRHAWGASTTTVDARGDGLNEQERSELGPLTVASDGTPLDLARQTDLAAQLLRGLGLQGRYGRFIILCGHAGQSSNNPLQAALDCGACCGHSGEANARYAARLLNHPQIRSALAARNSDLPADVHFVAAVHNTTTDELIYFDTSAIPASHQDDWAEVQRLGAKASQATRLERQATLDCQSDGQIFRRARDWSELQPEWGLAGNAAFIIGPRELTQQAELDGRVFLHNYDSASDSEGTWLETIMTAPMVVGHWINMQYYASTVDHPHFGSGNKTIHNVVGHFGLLAGGHGDLLTGLPLQSLHNGADWQYAPLRLQVVIHASRATIHRIVSKHELLRNLIGNDWLHLIAVEDHRYFAYSRRQAWLPLHVAPTNSTATTAAEPSGQAGQAGQVGQQERMAPPHVSPHSSPAHGPSAFNTRRP